MKLWIVGSSHGVRLGRELEKIPDIREKYEIKNYSIRGCKYENLVFPAVDKVEKGDLLIILPFGNNIIRKGVSFYGGKFHLTKYCPISLKEYQDLCEDLYQKTLLYSGNILIISNFYRHLCCPVHTYKGWISLQRKFNNLLKEKFAGLESIGIKVLDHLRLVHAYLGVRKVKQLGVYSGLQVDAVHFKDYSVIARNVYNAFF